MGIIILLSVVGLAAALVLILETRSNKYVDDLLMFFLVVITVLFFAAAAILGAHAWYYEAYKDVTTEQWRNRYISLTTQLQEGYYNRITYDGRKAMMDDILEYNNEVIDGRAKHHSIWLGALYPEDWDSLPLIEYKNYMEE